MIKFIKKLFGGKKVEEVQDPVLGKLRFSDDGDWWQAKVKIGNKEIGFNIGGNTVPDAALIAHAHEILNSYDHFEWMVSDFLVNEASNVKHLKGCLDEISKLVIEDVNLFWPTRPNDGMIFFKGPDEYKVWRCDYINRKPVGLGFDR